jgi:hypothetical protein
MAGERFLARCHWSLVRGHRWVRDPRSIRLSPRRVRRPGRH